MIILRAIAGVVVGYLVYAIGSMMLVGLVMSSEGPAFMVLGLVGLALIGAVAGALAALIAGTQAKLAVYIAAGLVALATVANLALGLGAEPTWYKVGTLLLTAPALVLVGLRFSR